MMQSSEDYSVIVSDDCSPEDLKSRLAPLLSSPRITYSRNDSNIGSEHLVDHWNQLLAQVNSDFVIIASDDDLYDERFLSTVENLIDKYPNCDLFHVRSKVIDSNDRVLMDDAPCNEYMSQDSFLDFLLSGSSVLCVGNYVFRTSALKKIGGFVNFPLAWKSDTATQLLLAKNGVATTSDILFSFRRSGMNISTERGNPTSDRLKIQACRAFRDWMKSNRLGDCKIISKRVEGEIRSYYKTLSFHEFMTMYVRMLKDGWFSSFKSRVSFVLSYIF